MDPSNLNGTKAERSTSQCDGGWSDLWPEGVPWRPGQTEKTQIQFLFTLMPLNLNIRFCDITM